MKKLWFPMYVNSWLGNINTRALTFSEKGLYVDLLCLMYQTDTCSLPNDIEYLSRILNCSPIQFELQWKNLSNCFCIDKNNNIYSKKLTEEHEKAQNRSERATKAIQKRWKIQNELQTEKQNVIQTVIQDTDTDTTTTTNTDKKKESEKSKISHPFVFQIPEKYQKLISNFWQYLQNNHPHQFKEAQKRKEKTEKAWVDVLEKAERIEAIPLDKIKMVIEWVQNHDFWSTNFRTLSKLRTCDKDGNRYIVRWLDEMDATQRKKKKENEINPVILEKRILDYIRGGKSISKIELAVIQKLGGKHRLSYMKQDEFSELIRTQGIDYYNNIKRSGIEDQDHIPVIDMGSLEKLTEKKKL